MIHEELAETLFISGLDAAEFGSLDAVFEVALDDVYVPLELVLYWQLLIPVEGELGKELAPEDSLVVVYG